VIRPFVRLVGRPFSRQNVQMAQQDVELILARQLAGGLAVPILLINARGDWLFINEPAELLFGRRFDEIDAMPIENRTAILAPRYEDGTPMPAEGLPGMRALRERRPAHGALYIHGLDGEPRQIEATAIPLESAAGHLLGAFIVLWAHEDEASEAAPQPSPATAHPGGGSPGQS
jgi:PAS domain-containing protein